MNLVPGMRFKDNDARRSRERVVEVVGFVNRLGEDRVWAEKVLVKDVDTGRTVHSSKDRFFEVPHYRGYTLVQQ